MYGSVLMLSASDFHFQVLRRFKPKAVLPFIVNRSGSDIKMDIRLAEAGAGNRTS